MVTLLIVIVQSLSELTFWNGASYLDPKFRAPIQYMEVKVPSAATSRDLAVLIAIGLLSRSYTNYDT